MAPAQPVRVVETAGELPRVQPTRPTVQDPRSRIREQVMAERGLDLGDLMKLGPEARIQTEIALAGEVAKRMGSNRMIDIRV